MPTHAGCATAQDAALTALVEKVSHNEAVAAESLPHYFFYSEERSDRTGQHLWLEATAETAHGPLRRLLAEDGHPLDAERQTQVDQRIAALAADPYALDQVNRSRLQDQQRGEQMLRLPAAMFLYTELSRQDGRILIAFQPNPAYDPATYSDRVLHAAAGTIQIDQSTLRMHAVDAHLTQVVKFGYGLLGVIQSGTVHMVRTETPRGDYKPEILDFNVAGHVLLFHTLGREQHLSRHGYVFLPQNQSLQDAAKIVLAAHE